MSDDPNLEVITPAGSPAAGGDGGRRRFVVWGLALLVLAVGFAAGRAAGGSPQPDLPCRDRVVGLIEADGLPDAVLGVLAPLRPAESGRGEDPLPLPGSQTVELVGTAVGHQEFRPDGGKLVLAIEVPRSSIGKPAEIMRGDGLVGRVPITSPLCRVDEDHPAPSVTSGGEQIGGTVPDVLYILERFSGTTANPSVVRVVDLAAGTSRKVELPIGPGDPDPAMLLRGDRLVFWRGGPVPVETNVWSIAVAELGGEPRPLGRARWFLAGAEPDQVWLIIEGDGADISRSAELVDTDGHVLISSTPLPDGYPAAGLADGLVLGTQTGLIRWFADGTPSVTLASEEAHVVSSTAEAVLWVPQRDAGELHITALSTRVTDRVVPMPFSTINGSSTDERFATALGSRAVIVDIRTGEAREFELPIGGVSWALAWSEDGKRLYLGGREPYGSARLWVWNGDTGQLAERRLDLEGLVELQAGS